MRWPKLTRRSFLKGVGIATAAGAAVGVLPGCTHPEQHEVPEPLVVDADKAIDVLEEYEETDLDMAARLTWTLPLGSVPHESEGTWVSVTQAGTSASPMVKGCALSLDSQGSADGVAEATVELAEVVSDVRGDTHNTVIYDVRCSDSVYAWVELNVLTHAWKLYASPFKDGALEGTTTTLWESGANYDPPGFVCTGKSVLWQVIPSLSGKKTSEHSFCYLWNLGDENAQSVVESPGRFPIAPSISGDTVILAPRVRADEGVYYGVTAYSLEDDLKTIVDQMVLPQTIKPFYATRVGDRFAVSIEANYSSGGMFGSMGTYIGPSEGPFIRLPREPSANVAGKDDTFIVKSRASYFVIDTRKAVYGILTAANRSVDYGEYPIRVGETSDLVTFATVKDEQTGYPASVVMRSFKI